MLKYKPKYFVKVLRKCKEGKKRYRTMMTASNLKVIIIKYNAFMKNIK